ncbi:hypothetical protein H2198_008923 [Neophaeococcomyces mojaviensis]|uniref:Uncharacterized protein n=1 Tax=Neophaeococcomyces mojaviensis TaxID=3383035 RepID=A0ACC2ZW54_9EURO|nr:hypothetical protein H2198_008923 [Knufia sp. JES_112]
MPPPAPPTPKASTKRVLRPGPSIRPGVNTSVVTKWKAFWDRGAPPEWPDLTKFEKWCARFWRENRRECEPKCLNCYTQRLPMPSGAEKPDEAIVLELMEVLNIFKFGSNKPGKDADLPVSTGRHGDVYLRFAERIAGIPSDSTPEAFWRTLLVADGGADNRSAGEETGENNN